MNAKKIPLNQVPNQIVTVELSGDTYDIELRTMLNNLYISIQKNGVFICQNQVCQNCNPIGKFVFYDHDSEDDPKYAELSTRFILVFIY